jgi:copper homeostasis protein
MLLTVNQKVNIPVYVMIRPRGGDFFYSDDEFQIMLRDAELCKERGFKGVVFGILDAYGNVDKGRCKELLSVCGDMKATFHRAFDRVKNQRMSMLDLIDLGFERVLTSGGESDVEKGKEAIKDLQAAFGNQIIVMPGCGVSSKNAKQIADYCGITEIHATAKHKVESLMQYSKSHFTDDRFESSLEEIRALKAALSK